MDSEDEDEFGAESLLERRTRIGCGVEIEPDPDLDPGSPDPVGDDLQDLPDLLAPARKARIRSMDAPTGMKMPSLSDSIVAPRAVSSTYLPYAPILGR